MCVCVYLCVGVCMYLCVGELILISLYKYNYYT